MSLTRVSYSMINGASINVLDFGAVGDGVTDDKAAIQAAFDYANSIGGAVVYFPPGNFVHSGNLSLHTNTTVVGSGHGTAAVSGQHGTTLICTNASAHGISVGGDFVTISNLRLHNSVSGTGWAIYGTGVMPEFLMENFTVTGYKKGIYLAEAINCTMRNSRMQGQGKSVVGGIGIQLGETTAISTTVTLQSTYFQNYETGVWNKNCPSLLLLHPVFETALTALKVEKRTTVIQGYWEAVDTWHIYAIGDGVLLFGDYQLDSTKVYLDPTYAANWSVIIPHQGNYAGLFKGAYFAPNFTAKNYTTYGGWTVRTDTSGSGTTLYASDMTQGILRRSGPSAPFSDTTATAADILALVNNCQPGTTFELNIQNTTGSTMTLLAGSGITLSGTTTISANSSRRFMLIVTNVTSPAIDMVGL